MGRKAIAEPGNRQREYVGFMPHDEHDGELCLATDMAG
jgi:hypothetical protein